MPAPRFYNVSIKVTAITGVPPDLRGFKKTIEEITKDVLLKRGNAAKTDLEGIIKDWNHQPDFRVRVSGKGTTHMTLRVYPVGKNAPIFTGVDLGTTPHIITPTKSKWLYFTVGKNPKTLPLRSLRKSGGVPAGELKFVRAGHVYHPGTDPREFTKEVEDRHFVTGWQEEITKEIRLAVKNMNSVAGGRK